MKTIQKISATITFLLVVGTSTIGLASSEQKTIILRVDTPLAAAQSIDIEISSFNLETTIQEFLLAGNSSVLDMPVVNPSSDDPSAWSPKEKFRGHNRIRGLS